MKLQDRLPDRVVVDGRRYRLDLDFRNVLRMLEIIARSDLIPEARDYLALKCVMRRPPRHPTPVLAAVRMLLFPDQAQAPDRDKLTDFEQDAGYILAAFRQCYQIDLHKDRLHWLDFTALLHALPEGSTYTAILGIRSRPMPAPTKWNQAEREWLAKAKEIYRLGLTEEEQADKYARSVRGIFAGLMAWATEGSDKDG